MEISSNKFLSYSPVRQQSERSEAISSQKQAEPQQEENKRSEIPPRQTDSKPQQSGQDYRQLLLQSRYQQAGAGQENRSQQRETYRIGSESYRVQQALVAYRANTELQDDESELLPRLDSYV